MPIIDTHQHFLDPTRFDYPWIGPGMETLRTPALPQTLEPILCEAGVTHTVAVQARQTLDETHWLLQLASTHAFIAGVVGWVDLCDPHLGQTLDRLREQPKFVGVRHVVHDEPDPDWIVQPQVLRGLEAVEARGLTFDLLFRPIHLKHVPTLCRRLPRLRMVLDHVGKPDIRGGRIDAWADDLAMVASHPQVFCKLSGMATEADHQSWTADDLRPVVHHVVQSFGYPRLMYGSDWPVCLLAGSYPRILDALRQALPPTTPDQHAQLFTHTATTFYHLAPLDV
jgi:L-fuconolactonase